MQSAIKYSSYTERQTTTTTTTTTDNGISPRTTTATAPSKAAAPVAAAAPRNNQEAEQQKSPQQQQQNTTEQISKKPAPQHQNGAIRRDGMNAKATAATATTSAAVEPKHPPAPAAAAAVNGSAQATADATAATTATATPPNPLRPLVALESAEKRQSRKRKLFALLSTYDRAQLDELAASASAPVVAQLVSSRKKPAAVAQQNQTPSDLPAAIGLFPKPNVPSLASAAVPQQPRSLYELEQETISFHIPKRHDSSTMPSIRTFSIRFHEGSLAAMARWSVRRANNQSLRSQRRPTRASVNVKFRRCGVCANWGHLETQCTHLKPIEMYPCTPSSIIAMTNPESDDNNRTENDNQPESSSRQMALANGSETAPPPRVRVEDCDGFMIEQRAGPRTEKPNKAKENNQKDNVIETTVGGIRIKAGTLYSGRGTAACFKPGDVVAWKLTEDRMLTGIVEHVDLGRGQLKARCIRTMLLEPQNGKAEQPEEEDVIGVLFVLPAKRCRPAKRSEVVVNSTAASTEKGLSYHQRKRRAQLASGDGTLRSSSAPAMNYDGTYQEPRGRKPGGMKWDPKRGVWTPSHV